MSQIHLDSILTHSIVEDSPVYSQALQVIESLQKSPACSRLAASSLITSCQSIESPIADREYHVENLRSTYAAQLALCEISEAGSAVPLSCHGFVPNQKRVQNPSERSARDLPGQETSTIDMRELNKCLQSLETRPQHWTSYSNNRHNAVVMCQAARMDMERGENLSLSFILQH